MGNCLTQGAKTWAVDEEWHRYDDCAEPTSRKLPERQKVASPSPSPSPPGNVNGSSTTVKIKLTRKQLEELLGRAGHNTDQTLPIELLLKHAVSKGCGMEPVPECRNRHWQPALQTIPEASE